MAAAMVLSGFRQRRNQELTATQQEAWHQHQPRQKMQKVGHVVTKEHQSRQKFLVLLVLLSRTQPPTLRGKKNAPGMIWKPTFLDTLIVIFLEIAH